MDDGTDVTATIVLVSSRDRLGRARATARSSADVGSDRCLVVDLDGSYVPVGQEHVVALADIVGTGGLLDEATRALATLEPEDVELYGGALGAEHVLSGGSGTVLVVRAGVHLLRDPRPLLDASTGTLVLPGTDAASGIRRAAVERPVTRALDRGARTTLVGPGVGPLVSRSLFVLRSATDATRLRTLAADWRVAPDALDLQVLDAGATLVRDEVVLVGPWRAVLDSGIDLDGQLTVDGSSPYAFDLSGLDPRRPWLIDAAAPTLPPVLLSEHPALARVVAAEASVRLGDLRVEVPAADEEGRGPLLDVALRAEARRADASGAPLPDVLGLGTGPSVSEWALELLPPGDRRPVARYLAAVRSARRDLRSTFRRVPGADTKALAVWATEHGTSDGSYDADLLARAAALTLAARSPAPPAPTGPLADGVNLVGYLSGELGVGASARLMDQALQAAGVPTSTEDVARTIESRRGASYRRSDETLRRTTLLCVNAGETGALVKQRPLVKSTRVIGMWYWELAEFPVGQRSGFAHVDEVWVATDFMRRAIAPHAGDVPVHTVTPPLPQAEGDPGPLPDRFGIATDRPWFLFTFDFLSFADRKNPLGLVEAFTRAFGDRPEHERPTLVIKTINADRHPGDAERLRLLVAGRPDVMFLDTYLDDHERHVLVAHCTAYVSLHRAEGLGLTVAEAMAWGRPVITTGYGGVTQFCDEQNSLLVDWTPTRIEESVGPYLRGSVWAEPDLDHAASLMRLVVDDPERATEVGERAARDIRERHDAAVAGARMRELLRAGDEAWVARTTDVAGAAVPDPASAPGQGSLRAADAHRLWGRVRNRVKSRRLRR